MAGEGDRCALVEEWKRRTSDHGSGALRSKMTTSVPLTFFRPVIQAHRRDEHRRRPTSNAPRTCKKPRTSGPLFRRPE